MSTITQETVGARLRLLRKRANLKLDEAGAALNITGASISKMESGVTDTNVSRIIALCELYKVLPEYVFQDEQIDLFKVNMTDELKLTIAEKDKKINALQEKLISLMMKD